MHFVCVELIEQHGSTHLTRYVSYSLIYWIIHLFTVFHLKEQTGFVYVTAQTTKLVQTSTTACSSSAMLERAQLDALDTSNVLSRVETWRAKLGYTVAMTWQVCTLQPVTDNKQKRPMESKPTRRLILCRPVWLLTFFIAAFFFWILIRRLIHFIRFIFVVVFAFLRLATIATNKTHPSIHIHSPKAPSQRNEQEYTGSTKVRTQ